MPDNGVILELNPTSVSESLSANRQTGWFKFTDLARKVFVRRINATYSSTDDITFKLFVDGDSANETFTGILRANNGATGATLTSGINSSVKTLSTTSTTKLKSGDWIKIDSEIMKVIAAGSTSHTVQRGMRGTSASSHNSSSSLVYANYPYDSFKIGNRAKYAQVQVTTPSSQNAVEISRLEIEYE